MLLSKLKEYASEFGSISRDGHDDVRVNFRAQSLILLLALVESFYAVVEERESGCVLRGTLQLGGYLE